MKKQMILIGASIMAVAISTVVVFAGEGSPITTTYGPTGDITDCPGSCMIETWKEINCTGSQASSCVPVPYHIDSETPGTCVPRDSEIMPYECD